MFKVNQKVKIEVGNRRLSPFVIIMNINFTVIILGG